MTATETTANHERQTNLQIEQVTTVVAIAPQQIVPSVHSSELTPRLDHEVVASSGPLTLVWQVYSFICIASGGVSNAHKVLCALARQERPGWS